MTMQLMPTVLVVDDEPLVRESSSATSGVRASTRSRPGTATPPAPPRDRGSAARRARPDAARHRRLPLCRWIRSRGDLPVIMLTARGEPDDRIVGLEVGADDYVSKPFSARELVMRVKAVLRRTQPSPAPQKTLDVRRARPRPRCARGPPGRRAVRLTVKEFDLLYFLASNPRQVFSRSQLMASVWGYEAALDTGTLTVHMRSLRAKIERDPANPRHLETVWGVGYRFVP